jgi:LmbE family N-acetylglucosaminyl deacetylase
MNYEINMPERVLVIVAHPDDEILWCGGLMLSHPEWRWTVLSLCRGDDADRRPRFFKSMARLGASGKAACLDDGPEQNPLPQGEIESTILSHLDSDSFDLILTHSPNGEYTRHLRHEEVAKAVMSLWEQEKFHKAALWLFAFEDGKGRHFPRAVKQAHRRIVLPTIVWEEKLSIIQTIYGFSTESWEYRIAPQTEAFFCFDTKEEMHAWVQECRNEQQVSLGTSEWASG